MRNAFAEELEKIATSDERVVLLSGDIGNRLFDTFKESFQERFFNCGVAESNMMGVAAGLALEGYRPVVYTIAPFVTSRCLEQIRDDVCYHNLPVTIVAVGAGLSYASLGATHQSLEDLAMLRALPDLSIVCPADAWEVRAALEPCITSNSPVYFRMGKKGEPEIHSSVPAFEIGKSIELRDGRDACILSTGTTASLALAAADKLERTGITVRVENIHTVKPLDDASLRRCFSQFDVVATIEEHSRIGGFGSAVSEWVTDTGVSNVRLLRFGTQDMFIHEATDQAHARNAHGLTVERIAEELAVHFRQSRAGIG
jgi:transketolase